MKLGVWRGSGIEQRQQKKLPRTVGGDGEGEGEGEGQGFSQGGVRTVGGDRAERERERDSGRVIWAVCVREEGKERVLCVCGRFGERKMRNGGAMERWSGGGFFKNENTNARTAVWEM